MIGDKRFLRTIRLRNLLSFGPESEEFELKSLNVLIGPNGSGKSNLIEAISLLQAAPRDLMKPMQLGGGSLEWFWKGAQPGGTASIEVTVEFPNGSGPLRHSMALDVVGPRGELTEETLEDERPDSGAPPYARQVQNVVALNARSRFEPNGREERVVRSFKNIGPTQSVVAQFRDPEAYPELTYLGNEYQKIRLFREWQIGRNSPPRRPQPADLVADFLAEDGVNLSHVLSYLEHRGQRRNLVEKLQEADPSIEDFSITVLGGTVQLVLHYSGLQSAVLAARLSDGTVRYACLLAVLCHPDPPPLVCIEEPELGLHPDLLPGLATMLMEASHRMQLIVTTHSDTLVDGLTEAPESMVVCEKHKGATVLKRCSEDELKAWLEEEYGVGQLWRQGHIGGNRW